MSTLYVFFFCSGVSGLIYQVVWVRVFGNVFGNTVYSAALVIAVFMLGLGVGSYVVGRWADRRYARNPESLLRAFGYFELAIGLMGICLSVLLPRLGQVSALISSYSRGPDGWYAVSTASHLFRGGFAIVLLMPVTLLMGGTLTLLIRHLVRKDVAGGSWRIALLYGVNTGGAALGCFLTDFALVPAIGLRGTQLVAVFFNLVAATGALRLATRAATTIETGPRRAVLGDTSQVSVTVPATASPVLATSLALALSGFAAMGMEILWFRHFTVLLGGFRAVFSLLLTVILVGIGVGSLAGGVLNRRTARPAELLMIAQGLFVAFSLLGLATTGAASVRATVMAQATGGAAIDPTALEQMWFNATPILLGVGIPALLMGVGFPLANAITQSTEEAVGRRAGVLYLSNTIAAVIGSLVTGFLLLPILGVQSSATILTVAAALAVFPLYLAASTPLHASSRRRAAVAPALASSLLVAGVTLGFWLLLPSNYIVTRALVLPSTRHRLLALSEGITEVIAVTDNPDTGRTLLTNGHPMSSTEPLAQRYMRALAHIPLLSMEHPDTVLVIGFGVGNTTHAATLHPTIRRVDVVDLSKHVLAHAGYFRNANADVLRDPRVVVHVNDGRQHLQMRSEPSYDLITLEPPPVVQAGVAALYSKEFYALARARLKPRGYISQWLPVDQVPEATALAMIRAFLEVFPQAVLLSGAQSNLILIGTTDSQIVIDPARLATALSNAPAVRADLERVNLGQLREIVGTFVAAAGTLVEATRESVAVSDDRPIQEYSVRSLLNFGEGAPASVINLSQVGAWCPACFVGGRPVPLVDGLDTYLALLDLAYSATSEAVTRTRGLGDPGSRVIAGSAYLGATVPESADLHNLLGTTLAARGNVEQAIAEFREALRLDSDSDAAHWNLGTALTQVRQYDEAIDQLREAIRLAPRSPRIHNDLGVALALREQLDEAVDRFEEALRLEPEYIEARRNLLMAQERRRPAGRQPRER